MVIIVVLTVLLNIDIRRLSHCNFRWLNPSKLEKDNMHVPSVPKLRRCLQKSGLILLFIPVKETFPVISVPMLLALKAVWWDIWENYIWNKCFAFLNFSVSFILNWEFCTLENTLMIFYILNVSECSHQTWFPAMGLSILSKNYESSLKYDTTY